jgi:hypothetical protein
VVLVTFWVNFNGFLTFHKNREMRVSQGFWGTREHWQNIEGNKGTLANFWEQGNKIRKITVRKHSDIRNREHLLISGTWEHRAILEGNKGTRTPPGRPSWLFESDFHNDNNRYDISWSLVKVKMSNYCYW